VSFSSPSWPQISRDEELDFGFLGEESLQEFCNRVLEVVFQRQGNSLRLSLRFCGDEEITAVHDRFFKDPTSTDVISFPLEDKESPPSSFQGDSVLAHAQGELLICIPYAERQAALHGNSIKAELALYMIHGCLHLFGFDDLNEEDLEQMIHEERSCLEKLGFKVRAR